MFHRTSRVDMSALVIACALLLSLPLFAQTAQRPGTAGKAPAKPPAQQRPPAPRPAAPATPAAQKPAEIAPPAKPVAQDLRMKTVYTTGTQKTETVSFIKGPRERFEFGDMVLLKQHDLKRTVQITRAANTYLLVPDGAAPAIPAPVPAPDAPAAKPGVVMMTTTVADTSERKTVFGLQARHVKTLIDRQPAPGACDPSKQHIETDGWYVDLPTSLPAPQDAGAQAPAAPGVCIDEVKATQNGDPKVLGFPTSYSTTITGDDGKPNVVTMEVSELEITNLDASLFDIPPGMTEAGNIRALSQAVSDANEARLAQALAAPPSANIQRTPGVPLIGVPELVNKTTQQVDTRALRERLVTELGGVKIEAAPLAGSQGDMLQQASSHGFDYLLIAEVTDLKVSKGGGGGLGGMLKAASKVAGGGSGQDPTEAAVAIKLVQADGKARLSSTVKGKEGGLDLKTGLNVAKFAGTMYMNLMTGKLMMNALNQSLAGNLGGMGMLGNPGMLKMQTQGLGGAASMLKGLDPTAGAASFLVQQAMASNSSPSGVTGQGSTFDAALGDALEQAAKAVSENLKKPEPKKK